MDGLTGPTASSGGCEKEGTADVLGLLVLLYGMGCIVNTNPMGARWCPSSYTTSYLRRTSSTELVVFKRAIYLLPVHPRPLSSPVLEWKPGWKPGCLLADEMNA